MSLVTPLVQRWLDDAARDPEAFWDRAARELPWSQPWNRTFEWTYPTFRWFIGGRTNLAHNALDHHVSRGWGGHAALVYFNERGVRQVFTYAQLLHQVRRVAASLRALGIGKGDRITLYMPTAPEAIVLMLAAVRIGAIHSVVFAGFGARALADRIEASGSRLVFTADVTYRKGRDIALKSILDAALDDENRNGVGGHLKRTVEHVIVLQRGTGAPLQTPRDMTWDRFLERGAGYSGDHVEMEANEPAFILATSGTTAKPKLAIHTHGGYQVHIASMGRWCFGLKPTDVWWSTSDIGWIVGHSYMVYAPLVAGCTTLVFEGALDHPHADSNWRAAVQEFGTTGIFTSPTAVRLLMRYGDDVLRSVDHSRLERIVCAGETLNPRAWDWLQNTVLDGRVPVIDNMWQTETGGPVFGNPYGLELLPTKPGSATIPLPGIEAGIVTIDGSPCTPGEKGIMVLKRPFPGLTPALWGEPERYGRDYWERIPGFYYSGDSAYVDADGYFWFGGRADEIIKIAAHRLSTIEVESAFLTHASVAECGVTGRPDDTRGEIISAFVVLKHGHTGSADMRHALLDTVRREIGPLAVIGDINFVSMLPKTKSGKIMRRVLKAIVLNRDPGDITTIEEEGSVEDARQAWVTMKAEI